MTRPSGGLDPSARRVGVEHEYQFVDPGGIVDARALWPSLRFDGPRLDPGDANAVRCRWGGVATTDGLEAEIATPPRRLGAGGIESVVGLADVGASALADLLPGSVSMRGYSTHLNVEVDDRRARAVARTIADRMAPAMMLLLDRTDSPGLLVRPRHRRLELGGEYQRGHALVAALVLSVGAVLVVEQAVRRRDRRALPPPLDLRIVPSPQRHGWYIDRRAGGSDLYHGGRSALLRTSRGHAVVAQDVLDSTWAVGRPLVAPHLTAGAIGLVDDIVAGRRALPCEDPTPLDDAPAPSPPPPARALTDPRRRGEIRITTVAATWHAVTLRAEAAGTVRWIRVPAEHIEEFLDALDDGALDGWLHRRMAGRSRAA